MADIEKLPVAHARAGAQEAWDILFKRYQLPLYTFIYEWIHEESASLDIAQETFISAARNIDGLRDDDKFGSWLFGIAHQKCIQRWRRQHREADTIDAMADDLPESGADPADWLIRQEQEAEFMALVNRLSPPHRAMEPKLDALRHEALRILSKPALATDRVTTPTPSIIEWLGLAWSEVVLRAKPVWLGLATVWAALLLVNLPLAGRWPASTPASVSSSAAMPALYREQQRLFGELAGSVSLEPAVATEPSRGIPSPRSDRRSIQPSA